jgi:exodeoxyribonuclease V alpha subunit
VQNYKPLLKAVTVQAAFKAASKFRVFSPMRNGPHGYTTINKLIEDSLSFKNINKKNLDFKPLNTTGEFYNHRIIMVRRNDYGLKLFNGDVGIVMPEGADGADCDPHSKSRKLVWFESTDEETGEKSYRAFPCNMIPEHETAFAMTIHKSQGSQYENIMVIMPAQDNEKLFTKELLYTAITRAEKVVHLWCNEDVFKATATRKTECTSGLMDRLIKKINVKW